MGSGETKDAGFPQQVVRAGAAWMVGAALFCTLLLPRILEVAQ